MGRINNEVQRMTLRHGCPCTAALSRPCSRRVAETPEQAARTATTARNAPRGGPLPPGSAPVWRPAAAGPLAGGRLRPAARGGHDAP
eukprot:7345541-Lingulodinium_polyedra.AAC.1